MNFPADHLNMTHNFDAYNSSLQLNLAEPGLSKDPDPVGFEIGQKVAQRLVWESVELRSAMNGNTGSECY